MLLAVVDMQHSLYVLIMAVNLAADHLCGFFFIALEFLIKQILQPAGTPPFLQNLVASPVRHAELEHEDH